MKDKKDLRTKTKSERYLLMGAGIVGVITAIIFFVMLSRGVVNAVVTSKISSQYQDKELEVLKTDLNYKTLDFIGKLIDVSDGVIITPDNEKKYQELEAYIQARKDRSKEVKAFYDGKSHYRDDVTEAKINDLDKKLLKEKNQDVYQKLRNKLDTIQIWYEQTQDADKYLSKTWDGFNSDKGSLSFKKISMVNTYYKLIKNKTTKNHWTQAVSQMDNYFANNKGESSKVAAAKEELEALKNSPLTEKYTPANVDIVSSMNSTTGASDALDQAGITSKNVLYYNSSKNTLALMTRVSGKYVAEDGYSNVISSKVSSGKYTVKKLVNANNSDVVVTDSDSSDFGQYISNASISELTSMGLNDPENTTTDFNSATPVFWFKNNSALTSSIYFGDSSTIGFIYAGSASYNNSTGTTFFVN